MLLVVILGLLAGGRAGYEIARWRGLHAGAMTMGGALLGIVAIPFGLLAPQWARTSPVTGSRNRALLATAMWVIVAIGSGAYFAITEEEANHRKAINNIIAENYPSSNLEVDYVSVPYGGLAPLLLSAYSGYFTVRAKGGSGSPCPYEAFDYDVHSTADGSVIQIENVEAGCPG